MISILLFLLISFGHCEPVRNESSLLNKWASAIIDN